MRRRTFGEDRPKVGATRGSAAAYHLELGHLEHAAQLSTRAIEVLEGTQHVTAGCEALATLAAVHERRGDEDAARQVRERCTLERPVDTA